MKIICCLCGVFLTVATAVADVKADGFEAPELSPQKAWLNWIWMLVFAVAIMVVAMKNPRRTHLG